MLICINYHYIRKDFIAKYPSIFGITPKKFTSQLEKLAMIGKFISSKDLIEKIKKGEKLSKIHFLITFDDGLKEQYDLALPILDKMGIPAVFFANSQNFESNVVSRVHKIHLLRSVIHPKELIDSASNFIQNFEQFLKNYSEKAINHYKYDSRDNAILKYILNFVLTDSDLEILIDSTFNDYFSEKNINSSLYMSDEQIKILANRDMLGSHGKSHIPIGLQKKSVKIEEIKNSQEYFYKLTGKKLSAFSFPYGSIDSATGCKKILKDAGFTYALTMERAINHNLKQPIALSRFDNNDMPLGKSYKFEDDKQLINYNYRKWKIKN